MDKTRVWMWRADAAGCGTYRVRWPAEAVNRLYGDRIEVRHDTNLTVENRDWNPDVVIGQRVVLPGPSKMWHEWHRQGKVLITELDDSLWDIPESNFKASAIFNAKDTRRRLEENIAVSDWITVSTHALRDAVVRNTGFPESRILVIPNAVPPELVVDSVPESRRYSVGYLASPTHDADWKMAQRHVRRFLENNPEAKFATIGTDYGATLKMPGRTAHRRWDYTPESAIEAIDYSISIAPLLAGTFNRSKSDCKWVEASARGVASIVSDVTAYTTVEHNVTGVKVRREHEWGRELQALWDSPEKRHEIAVKAHSEVANYRTMDNTASLWYSAMIRGKA